MKKEATLSKFANCAKYNDYMMSFVAQSTARGYISALNSQIVTEALHANVPVESIFEVVDPNVVIDLIHIVSNSEVNKYSHSRYSAALRSYHRFLIKQ